jgi:hypothetical protein
LHLSDVDFVLLVEFVLFADATKPAAIPPLGQFLMHDAQQQSPPSQSHAALLFSSLHAPLPIQTLTHVFYSFCIFWSITISE